MIETDRLIVREFKDTDYIDLHEYLSDPSVYIFEPGNPINLNEAKELCAQRSKGNEFYAVVLKKNGKMIGHVYLSQLNPKEKMTWELGYIFNPKYHKKGFASEASRALVEYAFKNFKTHRIMARCNPENPASWKLLERIGFRREGHFKKFDSFRKDENGNPIWHDAYEYALIEDEIS